jgi:hypothetical protein
MASAVELSALPQAEIEALLAASLAEGRCVVARLRDDRIAGRDRFDPPGRTLVAAVIDDGQPGTSRGFCGAPESRARSCSTRRSGPPMWARKR